MGLGMTFETTCSNQSNTRIVPPASTKEKGALFKGTPSSTKSADVFGTQHLLSGEPGIYLQAMQGPVNH